MNTLTSKKQTKLLLQLPILAGFLLMTACAGKTNTEDMASRAQVTEVVNTNTTKAWAYCNKKSGSTFSAQVKAWTENNQVTRFDFVKAKLTLPESFKTSGNYIQMFRWKANSNGQTYLDSTPLQFRAITNNGFSATDYMNAMSWSKLATAASSLKLSTVADVLNQLQFVVDIRDPYAEFDVIKVVIYDSANQPVDQADLLIPVFAADPATYAKESDGSNRANILRNLHPMKSMLGQNWSAAHYQTLANGYCF